MADIYWSTDEGDVEWMLYGRTIWVYYYRQAAPYTSELSRINGRTSGKSETRKVDAMNDAEIPANWWLINCG